MWGSPSSNSIFIDDQLGGLNVSKAGVLERDQFVLHELLARNLPTAVMLSGGYSRQSYQLVVQMIEFILNKWT